VQTAPRDAADKLVAQTTQMQAIRLATQARRLDERVPAFADE